MVRLAATDRATIVPLGWPCSAEWLSCCAHFLRSTSTMHRALTIAATMVVASAFALPQATAQDPQEQITQAKREVRQLEEKLIDERAKLLRSMKVNGKQLDPLEVMREAVYLAGGKLVEAKVANFFILEELEKQVLSGRRKAEEFLVTEQQVIDELAPMKAEFESKNPGIPFWEVVRTQFGLSKETFMEQRKESILFDRVFFPGAPKNWPDITKEAIKAQTQSDQGPMFLEKLEEATDGVDENGNPKKLPEFWVNMMRQFVQKGLRSWSDVRYGSHGLPSETVLRVNDLEWSTQDAFDFIKKGLFVHDLERAMQEVAVREALRQELIAKGVYISDEEFTKRYDTYREPYDSTPFTVEVIATRFKGYPCLEAFRARWRLISSFSDLIKDEITDENLQAHADKRAAFFADGQCDVSVIPFQGRDKITGAWAPGGMDAAKERCEAVFAKMASGDLTFDKALEQHTEFFANDEKRGLLGMLPLNQLRQQLRENEFTQLLDGFAVADYLFFEAEVGKTIGPIAGPESWLICRVNSRSPARRKINVKVERERELVMEDFITARFLEWANGIIAKAKFE